MLHQYEVGRRCCADQRTETNWSDAESARTSIYVDFIWLSLKLLVKCLKFDPQPDSSDLSIRLPTFASVGGSPTVFAWLFELSSLNRIPCLTTTKLWPLSVYLYPFQPSTYPINMASVACSPRFDLLPERFVRQFRRSDPRIWLFYDL